MGTSHPVSPEPRRNILQLPRCTYHFLYVFFCGLLLSGGVHATVRYYGAYQNFGSGDTIINVLQMHGGPNIWRQRWNIECMDGEAMIGVNDLTNDFQRLWLLWCKFMFPYKPPSNGLYPFYPSCHTRNLTTEHFCYNPRDNADTLNSFVTGWWDDDYQLRMDRLRDDLSTQYKCCKTPPGYYIDYTSCLYKSTHDQFWEYFDGLYFVVFCDSGYVMTGSAKKIHPTVKEYYLDFIQCCRLGFGSGPVVPMSAMVPIIPRFVGARGRSLEEEPGDDLTKLNGSDSSPYNVPYNSKPPNGAVDYTHLYLSTYVNSTQPSQQKLIPKMSMKTMLDRSRKIQMATDQFKSRVQQL